MTEAKRSRGRPRAKPLPTGVTAEQIEALAGMTEKGKQAAALVLVYSRPPSLAATVTGTSRQSVSHVLRRCIAALEQAKIAAGAKPRMAEISTTEPQGIPWPPKTKP